MKLEDLKSLNQISRALWVDPEVSFRRTRETVEALSLLSVSKEVVLEQASSALVARARNDRNMILPQLLTDPFFRLSPQDRFILIALHQECWSYRRLAVVLKCTEEEIASQAWKLRVHLASQFSQENKPRVSLGAVGSKGLGVSCPEFQSHNPWTQRFLDEEFKPNERIFMQNHLMSCEDCRSVLDRCRRLYYQVESMIPVQFLQDEQSQQNLTRLCDSYQKVRSTLRPTEMTWVEIFMAFLRKSETRLVLAGFSVFFVWRLFFE